MVPTLKEALQDPEVLHDLIHNPKTFRFKDGASVVAAVISWPPHIALVEVDEDSLEGGAVGGAGRTKENHNNEFSIVGPMANVLDILANNLNFTYILTQPADRLWGTKLSNDSWTGMVGLVSRQEADIALGPFAQTETRMKVVDFTESLFLDDRSILVKKGEPEIDPWSFLLPLSSLVWVALLGSLLAVWALMVLMTHGLRDKRYHISSNMMAWEILFCHFRMLLHQGKSAEGNNVYNSPVQGRP
ncbi:glutamate receptor 2-like [Homarus americanus]|uniref:glutamate receptor 2-like n=1 Tax=Homarus americanus TaxID=6706 RepID=UPI001C466FE1|nr:glutamate receptor 2-like [Homarus americanus]